MDRQEKESRGLNLLKRSKRGFWRMIFSRTGVVAVLLLLQIAVFLLALLGFLPCRVRIIILIALIILVFLVLYLVLHNIALGINVVDRLPVIHTCNRIGGAVLSGGGCLLVLVVVSALCSEAGLLPLERGPLLQCLLNLAGRL